MRNIDVTEPLRLPGSDAASQADMRGKALAVELVLKRREKVTIDWDRKQSVQAGIRATVKTLLAQRGYPPDDSDEPVELVLKQTEAFAEKWATEEAAGASHPRNYSTDGKRSISPSRLDFKTSS